jgi:murein L,D-transpeptidase YafK
MPKFAVFISLLLMTNHPGFKDQQLTFERVRSAYEEKGELVKDMLKVKGIAEDYHLFIRAFKQEKELEIWVAGSGTYQLLVTYDFCTSSGKPGPKRKEGDLQIPEGVYSINHFNPFSIFHLSLGINYPNASDKILSDNESPGGEIYIHGDCVSVGCIPITDDKIKELYILAVESRNRGHEIAVHIFPSRNIDQLPPSNFWENLKTVYDDFEKTKKLRPITVDKAGAYRF